MNTNNTARSTAQSASFAKAYGTAASTNPNQRKRWNGNLNADHSPGQYLMTDPDAKRVLLANRAESAKWNTLGAQLRSKGYGAAA